MDETLALRKIRTIKKLDDKKYEKFLGRAKLENLHCVKLYLDDQYYNEGVSLVSDYRYDQLKDTLILRDPEYVPPVGAKIRTGENRVELPHWLGSMDKFTPSEADQLKRWVKENRAKHYVVSDKLDGVSFLATYKNGKRKLYTRGDGVVGADITVFAQYFSTLPETMERDITVRGELIIKKSVFEKYRGKDGKKGTENERVYKNARNMVAGLMNAKTVRKGLRDIECVTYEIVNDHNEKPSSQFKRLEKLGFTVVPYKIVDDVSVESMKEIYTKFKAKSPYEIDGVIVQSDVTYDRNTDGNPKYAFAFKMLFSDAIFTTKVRKVEWNVSRWGVYKPVVIVDPVELSDITIEKATAHNAKFVRDNKLGPGAVIEITRSKEVIPFIVSVVKPAKKTQMPEGEYVWDKTKVNISIAKDSDEQKESSKTICVKTISNIFDKLSIKHVGESTVRKMYDNGLDTFLKIISASKSRLLKVPEFQEKSAERIYTNIREGMKNVKLDIILGASGIFGFGIGRKRMSMLMLDIPDILTIYKKKSPDQMKKMILNVEGFSEIIADKIVENLRWADLFIQKLGKYATFAEDDRVDESLKGQKFVMTGFRDKSIEEEILSRGGKTVGSVSKNTTALIVASKGGSVTGKRKKAEDLGIPVYTKEEFIEEYL